MNTRLVTAVTTVLLVAASGGCSGMRNFLFGRGASCGACAAHGPAISPRAHEPQCGHEPVCGHEAPRPWRPLAALRGGCGLLGGCNCLGGGAHAQPLPDQYYGAYSGLGQDPYVYDDMVIGSEVVGDSFGGYPGVIPPGGVVVDDFDSRSGAGIGLETLPRGSSRRVN